jgi:hypothetical protein
MNPFWIILFVLGALPLWAKDRILAIQDIPLPQSLTQAPLGLAFYKETALWLAHSQGLDVFFIPQKGHEKVHLPKDSLPLEGFFLGGDFFLVTSGQDLFFIIPHPLSVKRFHLPYKSETLGFYQNEGETFWMRRDGVFVLNDGVLSPVFPYQAPKDALKATYNPQTQTVLFMGPTTLYRASPGVEPTPVTQDPKGFLDLVAFQNHRFLLSPYHILRLNQKGDILQSLPIASQRVLQGIELTAENHSYLFGDGWIERKNLKDKESVYVRLPQPVVAYSHLALSETYGAVGGAGGIRVFQIK